MSHCMALTVNMKKWVWNGARVMELYMAYTEYHVTSLNWSHIIYGLFKKLNKCITHFNDVILTSSAELMRSIGNNEISIWATMLSTFVTCNTWYDVIVTHVTKVIDSPFRKWGHFLTKNTDGGESGLMRSGKTVGISDIKSATNKIWMHQFWL